MRRLLAAIGLVWLALTPACTPAAAVGRNPLRLIVLPVTDALPIYLAADRKAFEAARLDVSCIFAASAGERDQLLQAGKADVVITDLIALALCNQGGLPMVAVRYSMKPSAGHPQFRLLAGGDAAARPADVASLRGKSVAISNGTVSEYVTARLLAAAGLDAGDVTLQGVPAISIRLALLRSGRVAAATLPEPLASLASLQGAATLADDVRSPVPGSCAVFAFTRAYADAHPAAVRSFLTVVAAMSEALTRDPRQADRLLLDHQLLPPGLAGSYTVPPFPPDAVPSADQWADVCNWLKASGRLKQDIPWASVITTNYLPAHD